MMPVQSVERGAVWQCGAVVAGQLRVTFGESGAETTVDRMLKGEGHSWMRPEQLMHLLAGMMQPGAVILRNAEAIEAADLQSLLQLLSLWGYRFDQC